MARRRRDRSGDRLEAGLKLVLLAAFALAMAIGGANGFHRVFAVLVSSILGLVLAGTVIVALGFVVFRLIQRRRDGAHSSDLNWTADGQTRSPLRIAPPASPPTPPTSLSHELLHAMEWKRFEQVAECYFKLLGFRVELTRVGADGGIDLKLFKSGNPKPEAIVQCKAWNSYSVGVKPVRELFGVMAAEGVGHGVFLTTSTFTEEARAWAKGKSLELIDAGLFLGQVRRLPEEAQANLLRVATEGDYTTPTCPNCGVKMVERTRGNDGSKFWGCRNYPRCRQTFNQREVAQDGATRT